MSQSNYRNRVVITGYGAITPLGLSADETWANMLEGKSGVGYITLYDRNLTDVKIAAEVKGFDPAAFMDANMAKYADRFAQFSVVAAIEAMAKAGLEISDADRYRAGAFIGSGIGGIGSVLEQVARGEHRGMNKMSPYTIPMAIGDSASGLISILFGLKGPNLCIVSSCSTGADAIGLAYHAIRSGVIDIAIAGGADAAITTFSIAGFSKAGALSKDISPPWTVSRPFDKFRSGFVMGEGAAVLVMESFVHAIGRKAPMIAEMAGYGATSDAHHITEPLSDGSAAAEAIRIALSTCDKYPRKGAFHIPVDYISAHGTSTRHNDVVETRAIKRHFGQQAYSIPVSSVKSMVGHMIGGAGALEAVACCKVIETQMLPPTVNLQFPDPECDLDYVPNVARECRADLVISNSFGFGGHNSVIAIGRLI